jgi:hypothetical protein
MALPGESTNRKPMRGSKAFLPTFVARTKVGRRRHLFISFKINYLQLKIAWNAMKKHPKMSEGPVKAGIQKSPQPV